MRDDKDMSGSCYPAELLESSLSVVDGLDPVLGLGVSALQGAGEWF